MARFVPNPDFDLKDVIKSAIGEFTCLKCVEKFEKAGLRLLDGKAGFVCPKCGFIHKIKC